MNDVFYPYTITFPPLSSYEESVWDHLAGTVSAPFEAGEQRTITVKVIDDRGNELLVTKGLA